MPTKVEQPVQHAFDPPRVMVTDTGELKLLQKLRDQLRELPPELVASADWSKLGDTLAAAGLVQEAMEAHKAAVAAAKEMADRDAANCLIETIAVLLGGAHFAG